MARRSSIALPDRGGSAAQPALGAEKLFTGDGDIVGF